MLFKMQRVTIKKALHLKENTDKHLKIQWCILLIQSFLTFSHLTSSIYIIEKNYNYLHHPYYYQKYVHP